MQNLLQAQPRQGAVFAQNDEMALSAVLAIRTANRPGILVVGFDATPDALAAVQDGRLVATIAQQPAKMGQLGVEVAVNFLRGGTVSVPVDLQLVTRLNSLAALGLAGSTSRWTPPLCRLSVLLPAG